jgi:periplasmic divalent cation tolerance protein
MKFSLLYVTHENEEEARKIVNILLSERLIACANIFPIQSVYYWDWDIADTPEVVTLLKTSHDRVDATEKRILSLHPYKIPCIMQVSYDVVSNLAYAQWIHDETHTS